MSDANQNTVSIPMIKPKCFARDFKHASQNNLLLSPQREHNSILIVNITVIILIRTRIFILRFF